MLWTVKRLSIHFKRMFHVKHNYISMSGFYTICIFFHCSLCKDLDLQCRDTTAHGAFIYASLNLCIKMMIHAISNCSSIIEPKFTKGSSWPWSYGSWFYNYLCNQCLSPLMFWVQISIRVRLTTLCDKVCQWLAKGQWFSPGLSVSSTNKTDRHNISEILLKVALNTIKQTPFHTF